MKKVLVSIAVLGCLILSSIAADKPISPDGKAAVVQAGFFTPSRQGQIWDTWAYFHEGRYYLYYLAGHFNRWDGHELALSEDGVHWTQQGVMIKPRAGVTWMGTGHIWKAPDFERNHTWVMNYSEWFGDKQDIMFATSSNLINWTKVDEKYRFVQDTRWYREKGRWDCIDTVQRPDGSLYGYFTADPDPGKVKYRPCGFGFAESKYGLFFDQGNGMGHCLLFASDAVRFGEIKADGSGLKVLQTSSRDMDFGSSLSFRLVIRGDMMELYVNEYLMNLKRVKCNGQMGIMVDDRQSAFKDISVWQSK